ncbi:SlyX family protein [Rhodosalinus sp. K401]|uniref:SlyX family protein n=1 Tax=Rhodosalinus sp. K401 TaxID=3239195 RepID=UPI0035249629
MTSDEETRIDRLERHVAELERAQETLSEVVTRQREEIDGLSRRIALLMEREAEREAEAGSVVLGDQRPPHW